MKSTVEAPDWATIPAPFDDGATRHLAGARMASVPLRATNGDTVVYSIIPSEWPMVKAHLEFQLHDKPR